MWRIIVHLLLPLFALLLFACSPPEPVRQDTGDAALQVTVVGAIHGRHRSSSNYSLERLEAAIADFNPDYVLTEIPPGRFADAAQQFEQTGAISEARVRIFPNSQRWYFRCRTGLATLLSRWLPGPERSPTTAAQPLAAIEEDPDRRSEWTAHLAARRAFTRRFGDRARDPLVIHTGPMTPRSKLPRRLISIFSKGIWGLEVGRRSIAPIMH